MEKFSIENICYRKIFYRKYMSLKKDVYKIYVMERFFVEN